MAELKTQPTDDDVDAFLAGIDHAKRQEDCHAVVELMREVTGEEPRMWGPSIIGFGSYHYQYDSGREGDWFVAGVAPRKQALTLYIMSGFRKHDELMARLGKFKTGKSWPLRQQARRHRPRRAPRADRGLGRACPRGEGHVLGVSLPRLPDGVEDVFGRGSGLDTGDIEGWQRLILATWWGSLDRIHVQETS